jgi:hypothetical protein
MGQIKAGKNDCGQESVLHRTEVLTRRSVRSPECVEASEQDLEARQESLIFVEKGTELRGAIPALPDRSKPH